MRLSGLFLVAALALVPQMAPAQLPTVPPAQDQASAPGVTEAGYWYHHRYYPYRYRGTYYRYHWHGNYYNRRYRCGPNWCYRR